jgi:osmoprotectant transport system substrate-binding protein
VTRRARMTAAALLAPLLVALALLVAACGGDSGSSAGSGSTAAAAVDGTTVKIADKGFTESQIVAQLYAQALAAIGYKTSVTSLGSSQIADSAVKKGDIDMYPEYTGTAYSVLLGKTDVPKADVVDSTIKTEYAAKGLTALPPAPYSNDNRVACTQDAVDKYSMTTLSDLGKNSGNLTYSANPEHLTRKDGLPLLKSQYGVNFKNVKTVAINLRYKPVEDGQAQCVYAFGTDPQISKDKLVVLKDDKGVFQGLPYQNFAVVNTSFFGAQPAAFAETIGKVDALLTDAAVSELNGRVDIDKEDPEAVAKDFLTQNGLL